MTEMGRTILTRDLGIEPEKISVIPHGIPDLPFLDPAYEKRRFGLDGRDVVLTFGLLSPNKGIEVMIAALPERSEEHTSELQSLMRISYAVFCLKKKKNTRQT